MARADPVEQLPSHVEEAIQAMAAMHAAHHKQASKLEKVIDRATAAAASPTFPIFIAAAICLWLLGNALVSGVGQRAIDLWPNPELAMIVSIGALSLC